MKVVKLENKKLTEEELRSNQNMHKPEDVHIHADIPYGVARDEDTAAQEHAEEVFDKLEKNAEGITPKDPDDGGVKIEKNAYSEPIALDESLFTEDADDDNEIAKFLKDSVEWLIEEEAGCSTYKLDDRLGICVGWQDGFDANDEDVIHSNDEPTWAIVAGIKVYTSDDMRTDYDWINYPYFANGDTVDTSVSVSPNENYDELASYFIGEFEGMKDWEIEKDGLVIRSDDGEEDAVEESLNEDTDKEASAEAQVKAYYNNEFDLNELHRRLYKIFGSYKDAVIWAADNDARIKRSVKESKLTEKKGKVEGEDDTVYQLVYDALFLGNKNFRPHIADEAGSVYDWEQSLIMLPGYNDYDLGIALEKEEDGKYAKAVADKLGLKYEIKPTSSLSDGYKFIATVRIPDEIANKDATEYVTSIGLDMDTIRPKRKGKK